MDHTFLMHEAQDDVGVAVIDIDAGATALGISLRGNARVTLSTREAIPLGHKVAVRDIPPGTKVTEYGHTIGVSIADIRAGDHVHIHNVQSLRWAGKRTVPQSAS